MHQVEKNEVLVPPSFCSLLLLRLSTPPPLPPHTPHPPSHTSYQSLFARLNSCGVTSLGLKMPSRLQLAHYFLLLFPPSPSAVCPSSLPPPPLPSPPFHHFTHFISVSFCTIEFSPRHTTWLKDAATPPTRPLR